MVRERDRRVVGVLDDVALVVLGGGGDDVGLAFPGVARHGGGEGAGVAAPLGRQGLGQSAVAATVELTVDVVDQGGEAQRLKALVGDGDGEGDRAAGLDQRLRRGDLLDGEVGVLRDVVRERDRRVVGVLDGCPVLIACCGRHLVIMRLSSVSGHFLLKATTRRSARRQSLSHQIITDRAEDTVRDCRQIQGHVAWIRDGNREGDHTARLRDRGR